MNNAISGYDFRGADRIGEMQKRIRAARGEIPADLLITGCKVLNVFSGSLIQTSVAVYDGVVVGFGDYPASRRYDLKGGYLLPGFVEGHIHIESSKLIPPHFAAAVLPHGTTTVVADPHEIANVMGLDGIRLFLDLSRGLPVDIFYMLPSCVPATDMETSGAVLSASELAKLSGHTRVLGLGEVMNFPGVCRGDPDLLAKILLFRHNRSVDGHAPGLSGRDLSAYIAAGPSTDHECVRLSEAREKLDHGMRIMIREGTTARNLEALLPLVTPSTERRCIFVSDDLRAGHILSHGHLDEILRRAVGLGLDPLTAVRLVTINPSEAFGIRDRGAIKPGWKADLVAVSDLKNFEILAVWKFGNLVWEQGGESMAIPAREVSWGRCMNVAPVLPEALRVPEVQGAVRIIQVVPNQIVTKSSSALLSSQDGWLQPDPDRDIVKFVVVERYTGKGGKSIGFVQGMGLRRGALASTVAHDSHNLVAVGVDDVSLSTALNRLIQMGGGQVAALGAEVAAELPLPVAGLVSDRPATEVAQAEEALERCARDFGSTLSDPFMALSFLALPVIPELKMTDRGLVDVNSFKLVPLEVK